MRVQRDAALRYKTFYNDFVTWSIGVGMIASAGGMESFAVTYPAVLSAFAAAYIQYLYDCGRPFTHSSESLAALQSQHPFMRRQLTDAWASVKQWKLAEPRELRNPIPRVIMRALVVAALILDWPYTALGIWLAFDNLLRPSEATTRQRKHLLLTSDLGGEYGAVIAIPTSKTSSKASMVQSVPITNSFLAKCLDAEFRAFAPNRVLVPGGYVGLQRRFQYLAEWVGLPANLYSLGSLRGGGAVALFQATLNLPLVQYRGRWDAPRTVSHYLQEGLATLAAAKIPLPARQAIRQLNECHDDLWLKRYNFASGPPAQAQDTPYERG